MPISAAPNAAVARPSRVASIDLVEQFVGSSRTSALRGSCLIGCSQEGLQSRDGAVQVAGVDTGEQRPDQLDPETGGVDGEGDGDPARLLGGDQVVVAETQPQQCALPAEPPLVLELGDLHGGRGVVGQLQRRAAGWSDWPG